MALHKVKSQHWRNGVLHTDWDFFDDFESAKLHAENIDGVESIKIYSEDDELLHNVTPKIISTYA
jgi:hypothetical protein